MLKVALTGGIGSGKTTVARVFQALHIPIYFSDQRAKHLIQYNPEVKNAIESAFGKESYLPNGSYNTKHISSIVFNDKKRLEELNKIVHPAVFKDQTNWFNALSIPYGIVESALLFETGNDALFDKIIVVQTDDTLRIKRIMKRDDLNEEQVQKRLKSQLPQEEKVAKAHYVIYNNEKDSILEQVLAIHQEITSK